MAKMNCPKCGAKLKEVMVSVEGARDKAKSYQCPKCDYFTFQLTQPNRNI